MAHVGKPYPYGLQRDLQGYVYPWNHLPRKWWIEEVAHFGPLSSPWAGYKAASTLQEIIDDGDHYVYRWNLTSTGPRHITLTWGIVEDPVQVSPTTRYSNTMKWELWNGLTVLARSEVQFRRGFGPWDPTAGSLQNIGWGPLQFLPANPAETLAFKWRWASWSEQPEYHPYRYLQPE